LRGKLHYLGQVDKGAHFHACDLQVHSPRDRGWTGTVPVTDADRLAYASKFVAVCRTKGLDAVAITDHHDVVFVEYIRRAAAAETQADGTPLPSEERLVVFPGIELTLALPCQALLIFDPDCDAAALGSALTLLGITPSAVGDAKTCETKRLDAAITFDAIYTRFSANPSLKGRFILLPNVNDGGDDSLLRTAFFQHYIDMPCVGGYVDGSFLNHKKSLIVGGKDTQWGKRKIGVFQTSDNRNENFEKLGHNQTWIKWSTPSAEALRQACLAPSSRLAYVEPTLPQRWIRSMSVSASRYFGPFRVEFNPQSNMTIGGRGSGKSTLLEYLRWGLCDQPVRVADDFSEVPNFEKRRGSLIETTLQKSHGTVTIEYMISNARHVIRRDADTEKVFLAIGDEAESEVAPSLIQSLTRLQGYSQKQLSNVSVRNDELLRLVRTPIQSELDQISTADAQCAAKLRNAFQNRETYKSVVARRSALQTELASKTTQVESLKAEMANLPADQKTAIDEHDAYVAGQRTSENYLAALSNVRVELDALTSYIEQERLGMKATTGIHPGEEVGDLRNHISNALDMVRTQVLLAKDLLLDAETTSATFRDAVDNKFSDHTAVYEAASSQNQVLQGQLDQIRTLSDEVDSINTSLDELNRQLNGLGDVEKTLVDLRSEWKGLGDQEFALLGKQATILTAASNGDLKVDISKGADVSHLTQAFVGAVRGAQILEDKLSRCVKSSGSASDPFDYWIELIDELLLLIDSEGNGVPAIVPKLASAGFGIPELKRLAGKLTPSVAFELSLHRPATHPTFSYRAPDGTYIPFDQASPGQQANALLALLFGQAAGPLLIDQPEDDLDNATALQIAESIWPAKQKRQLIVASHNPNLLVIGDAELVIHCSHFSPPKAGAQVGITEIGGIDDKPIRKVIADVMEGGENAFLLRMNRYGF